MGQSMERPRRVSSLCLSTPAAPARIPTDGREARAQPCIRARGSIGEVFLSRGTQKHRAPREGMDMQKAGGRSFDGSECPICGEFVNPKRKAVDE